VAVPRLEAGRTLARLAGARAACIDLSDGLAGDLAHLTDASGVGAEIDAARLPLPRGFARAAAKLGEDPLALAVAGGEDYELLFGLPDRGVGAGGAEALGRRLGVTVTEIGRATRTPGVRGLPGVEAWRHW
jgi:thiamine-monophosphate kinase